MMNLQIKTPVDGNYKEVMRQFDRKLFEALKPGAAEMEIVEFTGSKKGDLVHLQFHSPVKAEWISQITDHGENEKEAFFVDEGSTLPFPLVFWKHRHIVRKITEDASYIIDDITFKGSNFLFTLLLYPAIYAGMYLRKKIYREYFRSN